MPDGSVPVDIWGHTKAVPGADDPILTINWKARREGVDDYRHLQFLGQEAARSDRDPQIVEEVSNWFESLKGLVPWQDISSRWHLLVPENNDFDAMDFFDPYPQVTVEKHDQVRRKAADFILRLHSRTGTT